jgi:UDP-2,4-diacetamido-2,4,6-trideoxy-beta-L-altropyranose hydrolase
VHKKKIIFRVDGNSEIGLGHISRCCALADMLKHDLEIYFYTRAGNLAVIDDIKHYCADVFVLDESISYEEESAKWVSCLKGSEIVVLDGYNFKTAYQQQIINTGCKLVCIDDIHAYHFVADVVINHAPGIDKKAYSCEDHTQLCLGTEYVLLKKMFLDEAVVSDKALDLENSSILICFGGADPTGITQETLAEIMHLFSGRNIHVIVGAAYIHLPQLQQIIAVNKQVSLHINIKPEDMLAFMKQSHIAVTSASTIALEYICVKGNLFLKCIADNQKDIYKSLIEKDCAYDLGMIKDHSASDKNIYNQSRLIDGKSSSRLLKIFETLSND